MQRKTIQNKLITTLQVCAFIFLTAMAFDARAEYYLVYPDSGCSGCCTGSCGYSQTAVVYMHFSSPRRHNEGGSQEMSEYAWVPTPEPPYNSTQSYDSDSGCGE